MDTEDSRVLVPRRGRKLSTDDTSSSVDWFSGKTPPWVMLMTMIIQVVIAVLLIILVIVVCVIYNWSSNQVETFQKFAEKNKLIPRTIKAMEFAERIIDNPLGYLIGDKTDSKTREDYMSIGGRVAEMVRLIHDRKIVEHTDELEQEILAVLKRFGGGGLPFPTPATP